MFVRLLLVLVFGAAVGLGAYAPGQESVPGIVPDVVYGHKDGMALTFDWLKPDEPNVAAILFMQSGGWYSTYVEPQTLRPMFQVYLQQGFTVFIVRHGSAPKYTVPEALEDVRLAVRVVRSRAKEYGIDPERLGVTGGSAGGHLSLMLGTASDNGNPNAANDVLKQSSRVAAVVALCPPTDLRGWTTNPPAAIKALPQLKPPLTFPSEMEPAVSPVLMASEDDPPILMIHGDKDALVPIEHSQSMLAALKAKNATAELLTIEGGAHSFNAQQNLKVVPAAVGWFEKHLVKNGEKKS
jgi:acetyl esterase/lipase